ncbi:AAA family ATPase [Hyphobacterium sp. CCMP332]|nr:AAA family ATPase [Hyphobacterium sp. CCMP332]
MLLGLNATGKSNFLEALVIIFRDLDLETHSGLEFTIRYECRSHDIEVDFEKKSGYTFIVDRAKLKSKSEFFKLKETYLPKHVFVYYSGINNRMSDLFNPHLRKYYERITSDDSQYSEFNEIPRIFLVDNIHGSMALVAFYLFQEREKETLKFLKDELGILDFGSALFALKKPRWAKESIEEDRFWGSKGLVRRFLDDLWLFSLAPINNREGYFPNYKHSETQDRWYLYIKDKQTFMDLKEFKYSDKTNFFNALNSLDISDLIHELRINVVKEVKSGEIPNKELSEGEKQLLTVLGMLKFTRDDEALILLDEPDTHLNPMWKWKFLDYIDDVVKRPESTQIIFCSHDPLVIGNMEKSQVQIFKRDGEGKTQTHQPRRSPKGLGVAGILTSEMFNLPTTLDSETQDLINERNILLFKESEGKMNEQDMVRLKELYEILNSQGFSQIFKDPLYTEFVKAYEKDQKESKPVTISTAESKESKALEIVRKMKKDEK